MPIITPCYPAINSAYNVSPASLAVLKRVRRHAWCWAFEGKVVGCGKAPSTLTMPHEPAMICRACLSVPSRSCLPSDVGVRCACSRRWRRRWLRRCLCLCLCVCLQELERGAALALKAQNGKVAWSALFEVRMSWLVHLTSRCPLPYMISYCCPLHTAGGASCAAATHHRRTRGSHDELPSLTPRLTSSRHHPVLALHPRAPWLSRSSRSPWIFCRCTTTTSWWRSSRRRGSSTACGAGGWKRACGSSSRASRPSRASSRTCSPCRACTRRPPRRRRQKTAGFTPARATRRACWWGWTLVTPWSGGHSPCRSTR